MKGQLIPDFVLRMFDRFMREYDAYRIRRLKRLLKHCGENVFISPRCNILSEGNVELSDDVCINSFTHIFGAGGVVIGEGAMISSNCSIITINHPIESHNRADMPHSTKAVAIGKNVWVGAGAIIIPGVTIGDHAIIGAGAVVTKNVPSKTIVVGNPARPLRSFSFKNEITPVPVDVAKPSDSSGN